MQAIIFIVMFGQTRKAAGTADVRVPLQANSSGTFKQGVGLTKTRITILSITGFQPTPTTTGTREVTIEVLIENSGRLSVSAEPWKLRGSDGQEYDRSFPAGVNNLPTNFRLSSGSSIRGTVAFTIPADASVSWLRYGPHLPLNPYLYFDAP